MGEFPPSPHRFEFRVYYEDTDAGGIVYYANYLRFAERARTELMRDLGIESSQLMREENVALAVRRCTADYMRAAVLDDELVVLTELRKLGGASLEAVQTVCRSAEKLVRMDIKLGCMSLDGRAARLPTFVRGALAAYLNSIRM